MINQLKLLNFNSLIHYLIENKFYIKFTLLTSSYSRPLFRAHLTNKYFTLQDYN
jgi:hypothetical protein